MSDTNVFGGKKQRKVSSKKDKDGGAAIEIGSILAPAVLYGLRRMVDAKGSRDRSASPARRGRARRGGGGIFSSVPAPLNGGESIGAWAAASFAKSEPAGVVPATVAKPVAAGPAKPSGTAMPMGGGKRRATKKGGDKDQDKDDEPMYGGDYGLVEGGKRRKARKAKKGGADDEPMYGGEDESMDGGKRRKAVRKVKKGGADDEPMYGGDYGLVEGGKRRKAKKGGADQEDDMPMDGGKKKRAAKKGGDKDQDDDGPMDGGKKKRAAKKGGDKDQDDDGPMDGGKKRKARSAQKGGAMQLFQDQLAQINDRIEALLGGSQ